MLHVQSGYANTEMLMIYALACYCIKSDYHCLDGFCARNHPLKEAERIVVHKQETACYKRLGEVMLGWRHGTGLLLQNV